LKAFLWYAAASLLVVLTVIAGAQALAQPPVSSAVAFAAAAAWVLQLLAFAGLVAARRQPSLFTAAWAGGMMLRFGVLGGVAFWLSRSEALPMEAALVGLVGVMFVLVLLEAIFLRWETRS
jgi:hypothetical protein